MVLELAILDTLPGLSREFEAAFGKAKPIIESMPGFIGLELQKCVEVDGRYVLLVRWERIENHVDGFRGSPEYERWRALLHHLYDPFPTVEHYEAVVLPTS